MEARTLSAAEEFLEALENLTKSKKIPSKTNPNEKIIRIGFKDAGELQIHASSIVADEIIQCAQDKTDYVGKNSNDDNFFIRGEDVTCVIVVSDGDDDGYNE